MPDKPRVLIAGAGLGGLTAALALLQRGFDVEVFEQADELREVGAGIQLGPNGSRILIALGLGAAMREVVAEPAAKEVRLWSTGETWTLFDLSRDSLERFGAPYWMVHRGDFHRVLWQAVERAKPGAIHLGSRCVACANRGDGVVLELEDGRRIAGDVVVGADGVHSRLRAHLFDAAKPQFTGLMAWRGIVPIERLPEELRRPVGSNWHGPGGHVVTYPLRRGELLNFVGVVERDDWKSDAWTEQGTREECAADFAGWHPLSPRHHRQPRHGLQMGADRPRADADLEQGPRDAAGRCLPPDPAVPGPGRHHGHGGRRRAGALPRSLPRRATSRCSARSPAHRAHHPRRARAPRPTPVASTTPSSPTPPRPAPTWPANTRPTRAARCSTGCSNTTR